MHRFPEFAIGDVLIAPFATYVILAAVLFALLRPLLGLIGFEHLFSNPPVAEVSVYVVILALLVVLL